MIHKYRCRAFAIQKVDSIDPGPPSNVGEPKVIAVGVTSDIFDKAKAPTNRSSRPHAALKSKGFHSLLLGMMVSSRDATS